MLAPRVRRMALMRPGGKPRGVLFFPFRPIVVISSLTWWELVEAPKKNFFCMALFLFLQFFQQLLRLLAPGFFGALMIKLTKRSPRALKYRLTLEMRHAFTRGSRNNAST